MEYEGMLEKIKPSIPLLKEGELFFRDATQIKVFLNADKQKYNYVGFCYSESHYTNYLHFANSLKEFDNLGNTTIYCIVKLDKTVDNNYYIKLATDALERIKAENDYDIDVMQNKNDSIYLENYNSFKKFLVNEKIKEVTARVKKEVIEEEKAIVIENFDTELIEK